MLNVSCNIDKTDRINRVVIGVFLLLGAVLGAGTLFLLIAGLVLIVEGAIGWCGIPLLIDKLKQFKK
jgi:hypothetical protein